MGVSNVEYCSLAHFRCSQRQRGGVPSLAERVQSSRPTLAATIERARQGNSANVPDMLFSLPIMSLLCRFWETKKAGFSPDHRTPHGQCAHFVAHTLDSVGKSSF